MPFPAANIYGTQGTGYEPRQAPEFGHFNFGSQ